METWGKLLTVVLLTVSVMVIAGQNLVNLGEKRVEVPIGSPLDLKCDLSTDGFDQFRVTWYFNPSGPSFNESHKLASFKNAAVTSAGVKGKGILLNHTSNATKKDEGWYFCKLTQEIPTLNERNSSGTEVVIKREEHTSHPPLAIVTETQESEEHTSHPPLAIVTENQESEEHTSHPTLAIVTETQATVPPTKNPTGVENWLWILVGVSAFILIVLLIIFILVRRRCCRSKGEDPIYVNTRAVANKNPSPRPGKPVEKLKTVSSSQNLQNSSPGGGRYKDGRQRYKE